MTMICQNPGERPLAQMLDTFELSEVEKLVIKLRYGIDTVPHTLEQLGDKLRTSVEQLAEIERHALRALRHLH